MKRAVLLLFALSIANAAGVRAQEMHAPRIEPAAVDWAAAKVEANDLAALNARSAARFPGIDASAVPVLLPAAAAGFGATPFFQAGPAGYDAVFQFRPDATAGFDDIAFAKPVYVLLSGFRFTYALDGPPLPEPHEVKDRPGARRVWHENALRTMLTRYGVTYVAAIHCRDVRGTRKILSCPQAARIADRFVAALALAGGRGEAGPLAPVVPQRPERVSADFTYLPPGALIPGTGRRPGLGGRADRTVYADVRFPLRDAPAFANSQSFNNWGDCAFTGRSPRRVTKKDAPYVCKVNGRPLLFNESAGANYRYPWRDNFCEHRRFPVGQCPAGEGHQGQDIRPSVCTMFNAGADRCLAYREDAVAAADGMLFRPRKQEALLLFVNSAAAHLRLRYLHMRPSALDAEDMLTGRRVTRGEVLGQVGNYDEYEHGTTYHLHFDLQAPTAIGYVFVSPYMTLVASYERRIGARGREVAPDDAPAVAAAAQSATPLPRPRAVPVPLPVARPRHIDHVAHR